MKPQAKVRTKQPAKAKAKPKQVKPDKAPTITLGHLWGDKQPDWLYRCTLVTRYEVRPDGTVWRTQEVQGNGRKLVLKGPHHRRPSDLAHPSRLDQARSHHDITT